MSDNEAKIEEVKSDDNLDRRTLFVRSIPEDATNEELSEYFSQFVPVKHAVIVTDEEKKSRGFGFVSFPMDEDTLTALVEAKKQKFKGRFLRVDIAKRRDRKNKNKEEGAPQETRAPRETVEKRKARLIIRNLPWSCKSPDTLRNIFQKYGAVHDAYIPAKKGGLMKGFAFVTMKKHAAAERAVKESVGLKIDGREVAVDLAVEKSKWESIQEEEQKKPEFKSTGRERPAVEEKEEEEESENEKSEDEEDEEDEEEEENDFDELNDMKSDDEEEEEEEDVKQHEKKNTQEAFSVFVRNIPYDADKDSLKEHFSQFGPVKYALPMVDKMTGVARGSAFVAFKTAEAYNDCLSNAPEVSNTSMLISDDVSPAYVYQGRILSIAATVDRNSASKLAERNTEKRKEVLGKDKGDRDRRNLYLLNEGRITENSKLAQFITKTDMELREKSYKLRVQQLNKNATLHLSLTRLAIRNLPRAMTGKALKALGRKAVVQFATEVKEGSRQPLSKEEISRSVKSKHEAEGMVGDDKNEKGEKEKKKNKKQGVVKQAKVVMEVKGNSEIGRSRGYGFIEFRDHKSALMGLRWLNAHEVTPQEILEGLSEEEKKLVSLDGLTKRKLIVEFAIENAQVVKRRKEKEFMARQNKRKREGDDAEEDEEEQSQRKNKKRKGPSRKGNMNKGAKSKDEKDSKVKTGEKESDKKSGLSDNVKNIIGRKRRSKKRN
ncbi:hypothetical protein CLUG_01419 [Clavispora lusitaniae ATCC 42720]|uniref:RRM domain-containing protein n=1 Tax=Clavispora lusitaniae (strain ATCC 42720) TaxID=306902 RepID=C4XZN7_CLAL4|nr:uncharacterized protein CLUG_01419 [Clavispora lusitaniae ATCC 42720]EEQ37296.1 hypothetical protein CLUG_01419 [Clavispora lusitaniae ATCC 42720]